jgi:small subunit ribosomal protein S20
MPQHKSAIKRVRQIEKRNEHNRRLRSTMRTLVKRVTKSSDKTEAETALRAAVGYLDRMAQKGIIHKNNAANKKSSLTKHVNTLA